MVVSFRCEWLYDGGLEKRLGLNGTIWDAMPDGWQVMNVVMLWRVYHALTLALSWHGYYHVLSP